MVGSAIVQRLQAKQKKGEPIDLFTRTANGVRSSVTGSAPILA